MLHSIQIIVFNWKNFLFRKNAINQYQKAIKNCNLSHDELKELNFLKRKKLLYYAYDNIKFYKEYYDKMKFNPSMLQTPEDWKLVPILEKEMIRLNVEDLKNTLVNKKHIGFSTTGGSTGHPLKIYTDKRFNDEILGWRAFNWWNIYPSANVGIIHRRTPTTFFGKTKNRILWWPTKRIYLNASSINENDLRQFTIDINKKKIVWLQGYVGGLEKVADFILQNNIKVSSLKAVWSTSAPLSKIVRLKLENAFKCKIMNQYGSSEIHNIAIQCPHSNNLHINYDYVHLEVLDKNGKNIIDKESDIFVTNLENFTFPIIKYRIGDKGTLISQNCKCKIPLPLIKSIKGRISDMIYTPNGLFLDGSYLTTIFDDYTEYISQFQIYQKKNYSIIVYVKIYEDSSSVHKILNKVKKTLEEKVKNQILIEMEIVDKINDDKGKIRYIISEVKHGE